MILLTRVDHRLLHGQVAVSWAQGLQANCIFCVGDHVANDPVWKMTLKMGKPAGCKLVIKDMTHAIEAINSGVTDKYRMLICVQTIAEAKQLIDGCPQIKSLNLGNTKGSPTTREVRARSSLSQRRRRLFASCWTRGWRWRFVLLRTIRRLKSKTYSSGRKNLAATFD